MNAQQDEIDLREYLRSGSREALGSIARRHLNFVYGVARREMGDEHQAEDVTQAVFIVLSRCAAKVKPASLPGWLFVTTRNVAANARKAALRRQFHERKAAEVKSEHVMNSTHEQDQIAHIGHHLHEALAAVRESDRSIVIMRHVHGLEIAEISGALGLSDDATRKRLERAMEKLRRFLSGRGVTVGAAALCATLAGVAEAAPQTLSTTVVGGTASGGAAMALAKSTTAAMTWTQMKAVAAMLLVASILTLSITGIWVTLSRHGVTTIATAATAQVSAPATAPSSVPSPTAATLTYTGLVTDPDGKPVAGARVWSYLYSDDPRQAKNVESETTTDANGKYTLTGLATIPSKAPMRQVNLVQRTIIYDKAGLALAWRYPYSDDKTTLATGGTIDAPVSLQKPLPISVRVVDSNSNPVAGADVTVSMQDIGLLGGDTSRTPYGYLDAPVPPAVLKTDAQGMATFDRVPGTARAHVRVNHPDYAPFNSRDGYRGDYNPIRAGGGVYTAVLQAAGRIRVHMPMRDGQPLLKAAQLVATSENVSSQSGNARAIFDSDGTYVMTGLRPGTYSVRVSRFLADRTDLGALILAPVKGITVTAGQTTDAALTTVTGQLITGRLVDPRTKLPVPDMVVNGTNTDDNGRFTFYSLPGPQTLSYYTFKTSNPTQAKKDFVVVAADHPTELGDIETIPQPMIRGRLFDPLGKPVAGGRVMGQFSDDSVITAFDGSFALPVRANPNNQPIFFFAFNAEGTLGKAMVADDLLTDPKLALPGAQLQTIKLAGTAMITGDIVDQDGKSVNDSNFILNVSVPKAQQLSTGFYRPPWGGFTRDGNHFTFAVVPLGLEIKIFVSRGGTQATGSLENLNPGELRDLGELVMMPVTTSARGRAAPPPPDGTKFNATLTGIVVDDESNKPLMGVRVDGLPEQRVLYENPIDYTDQDGRFYLKGLPDGASVTLLAESAGYVRFEQKVNVGAADLKVRLKLVGAELIGKPAPPWAIARWVNSPPMQLSDLKGKVVLLQMGMSYVNNYSATFDYYAVSGALTVYGPRGLIAVGIYHHPTVNGRTDDAAFEKIAEYVTIAKIPFPIAIDSGPNDGKTHDRYAVEDDPRMVLIDKQGIVRASPDRDHLDEWIEKLLAE